MPMQLTTTRTIERAPENSTSLLLDSVFFVVRRQRYVEPPRPFSTPQRGMKRLLSESTSTEAGNIIPTIRQ